MGRLLAEGAVYVCPTGQWCSSINPGGYALAGMKTFFLGFNKVTIANIRMLNLDLCRIYVYSSLPCRCSSLLWGGDTHLVSSPPGRRAYRSVEPRRTRSPRHTAGQCCGTLGATPFFLRCHRYQQEAPTPALPVEGTPPVSKNRIVSNYWLCKKRLPPSGWLEYWSQKKYLLH